MAEKTLAQRLRESFVDNNPALGVLSGVKESFVGKDETSDSVSLKGLSREERIARLRSSVEKPVDNFSDIFSKDVGGLLAEIPQGAARIAKFGGEKAMSSLGIDSVEGSPEASQFIYGTTEDTAKSLPELGEQEFGISAEKKPITAGFLGTVAVGLETPFGKPFAPAVKTLSKKVLGDLAKQGDQDTVATILKNENLKMNDDLFNDTVSRITASNNVDEIADIFNTANRANTVSKTLSEITKRNPEVDEIKVSNNLNQILDSGLPVDKSGYTEVFVRGLKKDIANAKKTGDINGLELSLAKSKAQGDTLISKIKVPVEALDVRLGGKVVVEDTNFGRILTPKAVETSSKVADIEDINIERVFGEIQDLDRFGAGASEAKNTAIQDTQNMLRDIARQYSANRELAFNAIEKATTKTKLNKVLDELTSEAKKVKSTSKAKVAKVVEGSKKVPASKVKNYARQFSGQIKSPELKELNKAIQDKANLALANESAEELLRAKNLFEGVNDIEVKPELFNRFQGVAKQDSKAVVDIYKNENAFEYSMGKVAREMSALARPSEAAVEKMSALDLDEAKMESVFNYRETKDESFLSSFTDEQKIAIKAANKDISDTTKIISNKLVELDLLEESSDSETYIRTFLRNLDGTPASAEKMVKLRIDMGENFSDLLKSFNQGVTKSSLKNNRKYATAIERDAVLEKYGLKTDKDIKRVFANFVNTSSRLIEREIITKTVRDVAKSGARKDLQEIYDPKLLKSQREELSDSLKAFKEDIVSQYKGTKEQLASVKQLLNRSFKNLDSSLNKIVDGDVVEMRAADKEAIESFYKETKEALDLFKVGNKESKDRLIKNQRVIVDSQIKKIYADIAERYGKAVDQGFVKLDGVRGAENLRGVMGTPRDLKILDGIITTKNTDGILDNLDKISQSFKLVTATGDLFSIPRAFWMATQLTNPIKGAKVAFSSMRAGAITKELQDEASEFLLTSRNTVGDAETLKRIQGDLDDNLTSFERKMSSLNEATDIGSLKEVKKSIANGFQALEKWQFDTLLTQAKVQTWDTLRKDLMSKGYGKREASVEAGRVVDTFTGVTDMKKMMTKYPNMSKDVQKFMRVLIYAPNLLISTFKMLGVYKDIGKAGARGAIARRAAFNTIVYGAGIAQMMSYAMNGHSTFENENPDKFLSLQTNFKDETGNNYYINPLGWIARPFELANKPLRTLQNKVGGISRFGLNLFLGNQYEGTTDSRAGDALEGIIPLPFSMQNLLKYATAQFKDEPQYGVADDPLQQTYLSALEFFGFEGNYASSNPKTQSIAKLVRDVNNAIKNGQNAGVFADNSVFEAYALSRTAPTQKDLYKKKYGIEGRTSDDSFINALRKMPEGARDDFISDYAESTQKQIRRDLDSGTGLFQPKKIDFGSSKSIDFGNDSKEIDFGAPRKIDFGN